MFNKFEQFVNSLGDWNHAFLALFFVPAAAGVLYVLGAFFGGAFCISLAYYFREVTHYRDNYNPNSWDKHDRRQQVLLVMVSFALATALHIYFT
mgnify:CR=1 FL=1